MDTGAGIGLAARCSQPAGVMTFVRMSFAIVLYLYLELGPVRGCWGWAGAAAGWARRGCTATGIGFGVSTSRYTSTGPQIGLAENSESLVPGACRWKIA